MGIFVLLCLTAGLALLDIIWKSCIENTMIQGEERTACKGKLILRKVYNKGFCLNIMEERKETVRRVSLAGALFFTAWYLIMLPRRKQYAKKIGLSLVTAGAWSNTFDRLVRGYVIDHMAIRTKNKKVSDITFNLADIYIAAGSILVLLTSLFRAGKK